MLIIPVFKARRHSFPWISLNEIPRKLGLAIQFVKLNRIQAQKNKSYMFIHNI